MATDFSYGNTLIGASGPFKPTGKNIPLDARTRVETFSEITTITNPYVGMLITVLNDETNSGKMTDYKVKSLKANSVGIANTVINEVVRYVDYLGVSSSGGGTSAGTGEGLTTEQAQQLQTAYEHSQSVHVQASDIPSKTSDLTNDSNYATETFVTSKIAEAQLGGEEVDLSAYATKTYADNAVSTALDGHTFKFLTQAEYDDLPDEEKNNTTIEYHITDSTETDMSVYQTKSDDSLNTSSKMIVGAINEIKTSIDGIDVSGLQSKTDNSLNTTNKTIVGAINETFQSVSNGKTLIASAITDKGISTSNTDTFETMANNIASITTGSGSTEIKYVESIALDKKTAKINLGETEQLTATLTPTDATIQDILWKSSDEKIATVNNGLISTLALGNANITATSREGYLSAVCSIVIVDPSASDLRYLKLDNNLLTMRSSESKTITVTANSSEVNVNNLVWELSDSSLATISSKNGVATITSSKNGCGEIYCRTSDGSVIASCNLMVTDSPITRVENPNLANQVRCVVFSGTYDFSNDGYYSFTSSSQINVQAIIGAESLCGTFAFKILKSDINTTILKSLEIGVGEIKANNTFGTKILSYKINTSNINSITVGNLYNSTTSNNYSLIIDAVAVDDESIFLNVKYEYIGDIGEFKCYGIALWGSGVTAGKTVINLYDFYWADTIKTVTKGSYSFGTIQSSYNNKVMTSIGDSISAYDKSNDTNNLIMGRGWQSNVMEMLGFRCNLNASLSGHSVSDNFYKNQLSNDYSKIDVAFIFGGTNDFKLNRNLGEMGGDESYLGNETVAFYPQYRRIIDYIKSQNSNVEIILITPLQRNNGNYDINTTNSVGCKLVDYVNAVKEIGSYYGLKVIDLYNNSFITMNNLDIYTQDGLHPTVKGHELIGNEITYYILNS